MRKSFKYVLLLLVSSFVFYSCTGDNGVGPNDDDGGGTEKPPKEKGLKFPKKEMRAAWIATAWGLDWPQGKHNEAAQKQEYIDYLKEFKKLHINAIFFQVKPMGDAFYQSSYEPWSEFITGTRGKDPGYDVLKFLVTEAHKRGIEFHAWMNPYRIDTRANAGQSYAPLASTVPSDWVLNLSKIQIYNPALPEVRQRLVDIVKELIDKYDVDGVHFDDYFYPAGESYGDQDDYKKYGGSYATVEDFRRANVNKAIKAVHDVIVAEKPAVVFSVAPSPDESYNYNTLFADVKKWCKEGWIDVVIPQLYHEIGNPYNDFQKNLNYWSHYHAKAALMVGYGFYRFGDPSAPAAFQSTEELERQLNMTKRNKNVQGDVFYSAKYFFLDRIGITDKLASIYKHPSVIPFLGRHVASAPTKPDGVRIENGELKWDVSGNLRSVVYYFPDKKKEGKVYAITSDHSISIDSPGSYCVTTLNTDNQESDHSDIVELK
jgi:uncharacterized lipoprotein YddW (UPF0748 family)